MLLVTLFWVSCDGMSIPSTRGWEGGGLIILLVSLSWVSCDGIAESITSTKKILIDLRLVLVFWFNKFVHLSLNFIFDITVRFSKRF